ncbi:hypothetical protein [Carboxydothermus ferrireducens]|uniref:hypothetical protein n=1 Tax=Carboxydothermus ferrireducens TaxID=54265 RepID=UPI001376B3F0|nr:hypothetical protein [Carboxydothermus ferrireducens]
MCLLLFNVAVVFAGNGHDNGKQKSPSSWLTGPAPNGAFIPVTETQKIYVPEQGHYETRTIPEIGHWEAKYNPPVYTTVWVNDTCYRTIPKTCTRIVPATCYRTVQSTCPTTVPDTCTRKVPSTCTRTVNDTCTRQVRDTCYRRGTCTDKYWDCWIEFWEDWGTKCHSECVIYDSKHDVCKKTKEVCKQVKQTGKRTVCGWKTKTYTCDVPYTCYKTETYTCTKTEQYPCERTEMYTCNRIVEVPCPRTEPYDCSTEEKYDCSTTEPYTCQKPVEQLVSPGGWTQVWVVDQPAQTQQVWVVDKPASWQEVTTTTLKKVTGTVTVAKDPSYILTQTFPDAKNENQPASMMLTVEWKDMKLDGQPAQVTKVEAFHELERYYNKGTMIVQPVSAAMDSKKNRAEFKFVYSKPGTPNSIMHIRLYLNNTNEFVEITAPIPVNGATTTLKGGSTDNTLKGTPADKDSLTL